MAQVHIIDNIHLRVKSKHQIIRLYSNGHTYYHATDRERWLLVGDRHIFYADISDNFYNDSTQFRGEMLISGQHFTLSAEKTMGLTFNINEKHDSLRTLSALDISIRQNGSIIVTQDITMDQGADYETRVIKVEGMLTRQHNTIELYIQSV